MRIDCMLSAGITQACRLLRAKTRASSDLNPNRRASAVAKKFRKPLIATSDAHRLHAFGRHYTSMPAPAREDARLYSELTPENVFAGLRRGPLRLASPRSEEHTSELPSPCNLVCR